VSQSENLYLSLLDRVLTEGEYKPNRTGIGAYTIFGQQVRYDLRKGFPLLTTKRMAWKAIVTELLWFLEGCPSLNFLHKHGCHIWDANVAAKGGNLGPIYGHQWRQWSTFRPAQEYLHRDHPDYDADRTRGVFIEMAPVDQIAQLIDKLRNNPNDRRLKVTAWNPADLPEMCLPPCHGDFECYVSTDGHLDLKMSQRSCDMFLGVPFNIASYALLMHMLAQVSELKPRYFIHDMGNIHIYENHLHQVRTQLKRTRFPLPELKLNPEVKEIDDFTHGDIQLVGYQAHEAIKAEMAV
jgi:thymidylate synthase